ncbi:MAG: GTPase HflX [Acidobacteriota bacterium]
MTFAESRSNDQLRERAALVRLATRASRNTDSDVALDELEGLARAAGATVAFRMVQERATADPSTLIGSGKAELLARACDEADVQLVIVDNELTPAQTRNLEEACRRRVIDRTALILDIFASRARTREGQLQVELAQLQYRLPRLAGSSEALSRLGGGIGTRGPGETKLETDRRRIRYRIAGLKRDIAEVQRRRGYLRARRRRSDVPTVALVGYTNAGKSTLFNRLTGSSAVVSDALFVTLDPLMRRLKLADARQIQLADTVGFIDRLPHQLVAAFHATLEEVAAADLLVHVIDASAPDRDRRRDAVRRVLAEVDAEHIPMVDAFNKIDRLEPLELAALKTAHPEALWLSAQDGTGRSELLGAIAGRLDMDATRVTLSIDSSNEDDRKLLADLYRHGRVVSQTAADARVSVEAEIPKRLLSRFARVTVPA